MKKASGSPSFSQSNNHSNNSRLPFSTVRNRLSIRLRHHSRSFRREEAVVPVRDWSMEAQLRSIKGTVEVSSDHDDSEKKRHVTQN